MLRPTGTPPPADRFPDMEWFTLAEAAIVADARERVDPHTEQFLSAGRSGLTMLRFDARNASLRLCFADGTALSLAVGDTRAAAQLDAAWELGGVQVRIVRCGVGLLAVEGFWEGHRFLVTGVPGLQSTSI
jgi:hypothetical protein